MILRERIKVLDEEIEENKEAQKVYFKKKPDLFASNATQLKMNMQFDMLYAAVFGNGIIV